MATVMLNPSSRFQNPVLSIPSLCLFFDTPRNAFPIASHRFNRSSKPAALFHCINPSTDYNKVGARVLNCDIGESWEDEHDEDWEAEFLGEKSTGEGISSKKTKKLAKSRLLHDTEEMDWCVVARKIALESIEARGLTAVARSMVRNAKNKNKKKTKKKSDAKKVERSLEKDDFLDFDSEEDDFDLEGELSGEMNDIRRNISAFAGGMFEERKAKNMETFVERLSQFSGASDRRKEINLNKAIVDAQTAEEVLEVTADTIMAVVRGLSPSPLSPLNVATALHRIAKNMEKVSMAGNRRLAFARQKEMCMLVGIAMASLPECSAQGISNIAWALSKVGGELLYLSEMDRIAEVALDKVDEFNSQNVANVAGAFASMRHSAPELFCGLSRRACAIIHTFQPQEMAQMLWAFASLYEPVNQLLDVLDDVFNDANQFQCFSNDSCNNNNSNDMFAHRDESGAERATDRTQGVSTLPVLVFNRDQLGNISWSFSVFGQMNRIFFFHVWNAMSRFEKQRISEQYKEDVVFASQVHLAIKCLKLEYPNLHLFLESGLEEKISRAGRTKRFNQKVTSSFQEEVVRLLVSTGFDWVREHRVDDYTLDAVVIDKKIALEIDGPTHFSRNSGSPLGHTMLKRRYITAAGWKLVSVSQQEWEKLQGGFEQLEYLRGILRDHI
ncbi:unnamed protein product [Cuscuta campestris]|uniref:RAP domain-containing protein n=1 Tax=Cuscuta campestris TaxID=132261 RepID=A0A484KZE6_9ASTE|nr:unnamed protein product [Cuscuta campestris]